MAEAAVPAITLTDPNNHDRLPSPAQSPTKESNMGDLDTRLADGRSTSPTSRSTHVRADPSSWQAAPPGRLIRTRSQNAQQTTPSAGREEANGKQELPQNIDPLSQHILKRTNTPLNLPVFNPTRPRTSDGGGALKDESNRPPHGPSPAPPAPEVITRTDTLDSSVTAHRDVKKGIKAVSFLSKLMAGAKRKEAEEPAGDDESMISDGRPEGNAAEVFTQPLDNIEYNPRQPQPPAYIKVRGKNKKERNFDRVFLAQELHCSRRPKFDRTNSSNKLRRKTSVTPDDGNTVWAMEFSRDGKYLAAAGADMIVRVWAVLSSPDDRKKHYQQESSENEANGVDPHRDHLSAPVFQNKPIREYEGHTSTVLDLSWSKNNFLLSSSMDKTVRLWHASRSECLCTFKHNDFVPSISFHPKDDRFFLAGSLDSKLRLWSIPDKSVAYAVQVPDMITAVAFTPDGKFAMAGCLSGLCVFYETEGLKPQTQLHVRSTRGQNAKGSKITGIQTQYGTSGDVKVLITSNDSRVRLYNFRDKSLELKFRGNTNNCSQIRASFSDDGRYVVCGSEDRKAYIWSLHQSPSERRDKVPVEMFEAHNSIATVVCMAPTKTRRHLSRSEDPVYDLCNPPPVTLLSRAERAESQASSKPPTDNGSVQHTPVDTDNKFEKPREPASYLSRAHHKGGNIIVTADFTGKIKVFRQDCAWQKRIRDDWDKSSLFAKRSSKLSRNGSLATRTSQRSLRDGSRTSISSQPPSERILSWRQGVASTPSIAEKRGELRKYSDRSVSPSQSLSKGGDKAGSVKSANPLSTDAPVQLSSDEEQITSKRHDTPSSQDTKPPEQDSKGDNPLALQGGRSYMFWDSKIWHEHSERMHKMAEQHDLDPSPELSRNSSLDERDPNHLAVRPPLHHVPTYVSRLSDEQSSADEFDDAREHGEDMKCADCGSLSFAAKRTKEGMRLVCAKCGLDA